MTHKKFIFTAAITFVLMLTGDTFAGDQTTRWKAVKKNITKDLKKYSSFRTDTALYIKILQEEKDDSENLLSVINSLTQRGAEKNLWKEGHEKDVLKAMFNVMFLDILVHKKHLKDFSIKAEEAVSTYVFSTFNLSRDRHETCSLLRKNLFSEKIRSILFEELYYSWLKDNYAGWRNSFLDTFEKKGLDFNNEINLPVEYLSDFENISRNHLSFKIIKLLNTPRFMELKEKAETIKQSINKMRTLLKDKGEYSNAMLLKLNFEPYRFRDELFHGRKLSLSFEKKYPFEPQYEKLIRWIDIKREGIESQITGRERDIWFKKYFEEFENYFINAMKESENFFFREKNRVTIKSDRSSYNENKYNVRKGKIQEYLRKTRGYLLWLRNKKSMDDSAIVSEVKRRTNFGRELFNFTKTIAKDAGKIWKIDDTKIHAVYIKSLRSINSFFVSVINTSPPSPEKRRFLTSGDYKVIKDEITAEKRFAAAARLTIGRYYTEYLEKKKGLRNKKNKSAEKSRIITAQHEIEALRKIIERNLDYLESLDYNEDALARYALAFNESCAAIKDRKISNDLNRALRMGTLTGFAGDVDPVKINKEKAMKDFIIKRTSTYIAMMKSLVVSYLRKNIDLMDYPRRRDYDEYRKKLSRKPSVKIIRWIMNEKNFGAIDKKAVLYLSRLEKRNFWRDSSRNQKGALKNVVLSGNGIRLAIPDKFDEIHVTEEERETGMLKKFGYSGAEIFIISPENIQGGIKEITEKWLTANGAVPVRKKWGHTGGNQFIWILARSKEKDVFDAYAVKDEKWAVIIVGKSSKKLFPFFRKNTKSIFESLKKEKAAGHQF